MNGRERFLNIAKGELKAELFLPFDLNYAWFMEETIDRWKKEGMIENVDLLNFFGFDRVEFTSGRPYSLVPPFEEEIRDCFFKADKSKMVVYRLQSTGHLLAEAVFV